MIDPLYQVLGKLQQELISRERDVAHRRYGNDLYTIARSQGELDGLELAINLLKTQLEALDSE